MGRIDSTWLIWICTMALNTMRLSLVSSFFFDVVINVTNRRHKSSRPRRSFRQISREAPYSFRKGTSRLCIGEGQGRKRAPHPSRPFSLFLQASRSISSQQPRVLFRPVPQDVWQFQVCLLILPLFYHLNLLMQLFNSLDDIRRSRL